MIYYDPHDDSFCAKNLREEEWVEYQKDSEALGLAAEIKSVFDRGMIALVNLLDLQNLTYRVASRAGTEAVLIQDMSEHWACLALAMLTHGKFEYDIEKAVVRFEKSTIDQEPMYYNNVEFVPCPGVIWTVPSRKRPQNEIKDSRASRHGENDPLDGIFGNRTKRDSPQQSLFPDLYEGR